MDIEEAASNNTQYTGAYWVIDCVFCGEVSLERMFTFWKSAHVVPSDPWGWFQPCLAMVYVFLPLLVGYQFRRLLKRELQKELLSARMFAICDWRIAQLLFLAYMGLLIFNMRY